MKDNRKKRIQKLEELMRASEVACTRANHAISTLEDEIRSIHSWVQWAKSILKEMEDGQDG